MSDHGVREGRAIFACLAFSLLSASTVCLGVAGAAGRPNVVLILTDDQGYGDLGSTGNPVIRTPHLDAMAKRSARLGSFYVSPVCAPTRASLMTGRYNYRTRVVDTWVGRAMMDPSEVTVAEVLRDAGYATGIFGKWHLGDNYPLRPMDQGFEMSLVHRGGGIGQPADPAGAEGKYTDAVLFRNGERTQTRGYCTGVYFSEALDWMEKSHRDGRPFFAYIPTNAPHGPFHDVPKEAYELYKSLDLTPALGGKPTAAEIDRTARIYAMITDIDTNVGRVFKRLEALGITKSTLVVFLVDNGPNGRRFVAGMRGAKAGVHEGGIRSPFFAHWPGRLAPGLASNEVVAHIDVFPTVLDACGVKAPAGLKIDGRSLLPLLGRGDVTWLDRAICIQAHRGDVPHRYHNFALRTKRWKLVHPSGFGRQRFDGEPRLELYDMVADPLEKNDVAASRPGVVAGLRKRYDAWFEDVGSTRPDNYAPPRIVIGTKHENPVVLTRQDWRHVEGRTWGADSIGYWHVSISREGVYDIRVRFRPKSTPGSVRLAVAGVTRVVEIATKATSCSIEGVELKSGETKIEVVLSHAARRRGPWQIDVRRRE